MTAVTYTAQSALTTGHIAGTAYTIRLRCREIEPGKDVRKSEQRALSGKTETLLWRSNNTRAVTTAAVRGEERALIREFLESIIDGATFIFDEFGFEGQPDNPVSMMMVGTYREQRIVRQGDGGRKDYFRFTFTIRET